jgi:hypothetical protein
MVIKNTDVPDPLGRDNLGVSKIYTLYYIPNEELDTILNVFSQAYMPMQYDKAIREYNLPQKIVLGPFDNPSTIILPPQAQPQSQFNLAGVRDKSVYNRYQDYNDRFRTYTQQA